MQFIFKKSITIKFILLIFLIFLNLQSQTYAYESKKNHIKSYAIINNDFNLREIPNTIKFTLLKSITLPNGSIIPKNSTIISNIYQYDKEKRFHKSGFFICIPNTYYYNDEIYDIVNDLYLIIKKYEPLNKKEAIIQAAEIIIFTGASYFAPGVDVAYFFTKGAIQRKKDKNRFKAGIKNAYDNSIFWIFLKGKPIELTLGDKINFRKITKKKAEKLKISIDKKREKENLSKKELNSIINTDSNNEEI